MALTRRGVLRSKFFWILSLCATFRIVMILLETKNPPSNSASENQHSANITKARIREIVKDLKMKYGVAEVNLDNTNKHAQGTTLSAAVMKVNIILSSQSRNFDEKRVKSESSSGNLMEKKEVKTFDIPYEIFLPPKGARRGRINHKNIIKDLPEKYLNITFLKTAPTYEEMENEKEDAVPQMGTFGDPSEMNCDKTYCYLNGRNVSKEIIIENPKDMFTFLPPKKDFMKEFKNPCWKGKDALDRDNLFCLPYFFIIGFTKCGTTDLFAILKTHILISSRASKETHFFDRRRRGRGSRMQRAPLNLPRSFRFYANRGTYREDLMRTYKEIEGTNVLFHGITMDATPSYVWDNEFWETFHPGYKEPPVTTADTLSKLNPKTKFIFSLRDPINRMRSAYQFFCSFSGIYACDRPITPEKYHNLVVEAVETFNTCLKNSTVRGCTYSTENHQLATHLYASMYHVYIADYMKTFPRDQLYILQMEEHIGDPITSTNKLCDFLEIQRFPEDTLQSFLGKHKTRNQLNDDKRIPYVLPQTTKVLEDFFKPYLRHLVDLLGDEKWYWNRPHL